MALAEQLARQLAKLPDLIDREQVRALCGGSKGSPSAVTMWQWARTGKMPAPIKLGDGTLRWVKSEIGDWLKNLPRAEYKVDTEPEQKKQRYIRSRRTSKAA